MAPVTNSVIDMPSEDGWPAQGQDAEVGDLLKPESKQAVGPLGGDSPRSLGTPRIDNNQGQNSYPKGSVQPAKLSQSDRRGEDGAKKRKRQRLAATATSAKAATSKDNAPSEARMSKEGKAAIASFVRAFEDKFIGRKPKLPNADHAGSQRRKTASSASTTEQPPQELSNIGVKRARDSEGLPASSKRQKLLLFDTEFYSGPRSASSMPTPPRPPPWSTAVHIDLTGISDPPSSSRENAIVLTDEDEPKGTKASQSQHPIEREREKSIADSLDMANGKGSQKPAANAMFASKDKTIDLSMTTGQAKRSFVRQNAVVETSKVPARTKKQQHKSSKDLDLERATFTQLSNRGSTLASGALEKDKSSRLGASQKLPSPIKASLRHGQPKGRVTSTNQEAISEQEQVDSALPGKKLSRLMQHKASSGAQPETNKRDESNTSHSVSPAVVSGISLLQKDTEQSPNHADVRAEEDFDFIVAARDEGLTPPVTALGLSERVEHVLGKYLEEARGDNEYWSRVQLRRARTSANNVSLAERGVQSSVPYSFVKMKPLVAQSMGKASKSMEKVAEVQVERTTVSGVKAVKSKMAYPVISLTFPTDMPSYAHFVPIKENFLAPNITTMQSWPYFDEDFDYHSAQAAGLNEQYHIDVNGRKLKLLRLLQAQKYEEYVESALQNLEITWADVLRFLFHPIPDVGQDKDAKKALARRDEFCSEEFSRQGERTAEVLQRLPLSTIDQLAKAATLCENFSRMCKFSLWHVARRHLYDKKAAEMPATSADRLDELTCQHCLRLECPQHGELPERTDREYEEAGDVGGRKWGDHVVETDIVNPPNHNCHYHIAFPLRSSKATVPQERAKGPKRSLPYWLSDSFKHDLQERGPFYGCEHPGSTCENARCLCFELGLPCEKICACSSGCARKFQGCSCKITGKRKGQSNMCYEDDRCICWQLQRECDADLCGDCGVSELLDGFHRHDEDACRGKCQNASIQRAMPKNTIVGDSGIHGLGLYAGEDMKKHDFVGEYTGEVITKEESERRGAVYDLQRLSYLFVLNASQEIDSTYFGNDIRFINHAGADSVNLYAKVVLVDAVHRIALFAHKDVKKGTELMFDYGPKFPDEQLGGKKSKARARQTKTVRDALHEVQVEEDESGNTRAKKVPSGKVSISTLSPKKKGIARPVGESRQLSRKSVLQADEARSISRRSQSRDTLVDDGRPPADRLWTYNIAQDGPEVGIDLGLGAQQDDDDSDFEDEDGLNTPSSSPREEFAGRQRRMR
ncbi:hypothetical protein LTR62_006148 [Meristemomyces frigidus]|uniref:SET domain-containing protein n=1 Tax=Meristemomyces frigidus TaxID=1508187 RepID=A0AAN7TCU9_9PEZI|nr:hypothetical protein LTR62_006148 [Meristemomyces frigidus]